MKRWHWLVAAIAFALMCAVSWSGYRAQSTAEEQWAPKIGVRFLKHDVDAVDHWPVFSPDGKQPDGKQIVFTARLKRAADIPEQASPHRCSINLSVFTRRSALLPILES